METAEYCKVKGALVLSGDILVTKRREAATWKKKQTMAGGLKFPLTFSSAP